MNLSTAFSWAFLSHVVAFASIYGAILARIIRDRRITTRHFRVLAYVSTAISLGVLGPFLLATSWLTLNAGLPVAWTRLVDVLTEKCLCLLLFALDVVALPASLTGIMASLSLPMRTRLWKTSAVAILTGLVSDFVFARRFQLVLSPGLILLGILGDVIGGATLAILTIKITDFAFELIDGNSSRQSAARTRFLKPLKVGAVLCFVGVLAVGTFYFVFVHQLPGHIDITLNDWQSLGFSHPLRQIADPIFQDPLLVPLTADAAHVQLSADSLVIRLSAGRGSLNAPPKVELTVVVFPSPPSDRTLQDISAFASKRLFRKPISLGEITIRGADLNPLFGIPSRKQIPMMLFLPRGRMITMSKDVESFAHFNNGPAAEGAVPTHGALAISAPGMTLRTTLAAGLAIIPNMPVNVSKAPADFWEIMIPGEAAPIRIKADETRCCRGPAIGLLLEGNHEVEVLFVSESRYLEFRTLSLRLVDEKKKILKSNEVRIRNPLGKMVLGTSSRSLEGSGEIYIAGDGLNVRQLAPGTLRIDGVSGLVTVNGVVLSTSAWNAIPVEIRAVVIAAVLGFIGWWLRENRQERRRSKAPLPERHVEP